MTSHQAILDFYSRSGLMSAPGPYAPLFDGISSEIPMLAASVQGLLLHEHMAPAYGVALSEERRSATFIRSVGEMLDQLLAEDARPLDMARSIEDRLIGVCRHFSLLSVAILRAKGVPARARCGFATYFEAGRYIDHWVCEYWDAIGARWVLADMQLDQVQRDLFKPDFDTLDVPHDRFILAGDAWLQCRAGAADPSAFGILDMHGLWFIAGNVLRDFAALNKMEMQPWDVWGAMPLPDEPMDAARFDFFDRLAGISLGPDAVFASLRAIYESDDRIQVPRSVLNARLNRQEAV